MTTNKTPIYDWHKQHGDIVDFAGWEMPMRYTDIIEEHMAVRDAVGIFDVSHMGRLHLRGTKVREFIDAIVPRNVRKMETHRAGYTYVLNESGGFKDDVIVTVLDDDHVFFVCNASNREKIVNWLTTHLNTIKAIDPSFDVTLQDVTFQSAMIAIQGPSARTLMERVFGTAPGTWRVAYGTFEGHDILMTGTGYTGEVGAEVTLEISNSADLKQTAIKMWEALLNEGKDLAVKPCGLGARDTLRMEAGYCLYGNDIDEKITPKEAALYFSPFADNTKQWFIGKNAVEEKEVQRKRVGFVLKGKGIPRHNYDILDSDGNKIGWVSSGTQSPILHSGIGMGYVDVAFAQPGTKIFIQIRKKVVEAEVSKFPLFDPDRYGSKRAT